MPTRHSGSSSELRGLKHLISLHPGVCGDPVRCETAESKVRITFLPVFNFWNPSENFVGMAVLLSSSLVTSYGLLEGPFLPLFLRCCGCPWVTLPLYSIMEPILVCQAAITKCHTLKPQTFISLSSGGWKPMIKGSAGLAPPRPLLGPQLPPLLRVLTWSSFFVWLRDLSI